MTSTDLQRLTVARESRPSAGSSRRSERRSDSGGEKSNSLGISPRASIDGWVEELGGSADFFQPPESRQHFDVSEFSDSSVFSEPGGCRILASLPISDRHPSRAERSSRSPVG